MVVHYVARGRLQVLASAAIGVGLGGAFEPCVEEGPRRSEWPSWAAALDQRGCGEAAVSLVQHSAARSAVSEEASAPLAADLIDHKAAVSSVSRRSDTLDSGRHLMLNSSQSNDTIERVLSDLKVREAEAPLTVNRRHLELDKTQTEVHKVALQGVAPVTGILMAAFLVGSIFSANSYTKFIPDTLVIVAVAMLLGLFVRQMVSYGWITFEGFTVIDATILNLFLLPIIIFEGGWSVNIPYFMDQAPYIMIFAILGTVLSAFLIGYGSWIAGGWGLHSVTDLRTNLAFASLICATDPVATLATFSQLKIAERQPLLYTLVFGESMLNDAIAIILFNTINDMDEQEWNGFQVPLAARMIILLVGSIFAGCFLAALLILLLRVARLPGNTVPEILYLLLSPFFIFSMTEVLELSGIIAVLFAGIVFKLYGSQHFTVEGERSASHLLEVVARLADSGVFVICGTSTALIDSSEGFHFGFVALGICLVARAVSISVCAPLANGLKRYGNRTDTHMVSWRHCVIFWLSGLRGGIGLVLALEIDEKWCGSANKATIVNATFFLICSLLLLCGASTEPCLLALGLSTPSADVMKAVIHRPDQIQWISLRWLHSSFQGFLVGDRQRGEVEKLKDSPRSRSISNAQRLGNAPSRSGSPTPSDRNQ